MRHKTIIEITPESKMNGMLNWMKPAGLMEQLAITTTIYYFGLIQQILLLCLQVPSTKATKEVETIQRDF
jgi:hypothetical protein